MSASEKASHPGSQQGAVRCVLVVRCVCVKALACAIMTWDLAEGGVLSGSLRGRQCGANEKDRKDKRNKHHQGQGRKTQLGFPAISRAARYSL